MAPRRVENATFAVCTDPSPWFGSGAFCEFPLAALFQYDAIYGVMLVVDVRLVPTFETVETLHDFMFGGDYLSREPLATVLFELSAAQLDVLI